MPVVTCRLVPRGRVASMRIIAFILAAVALTSSDAVAQERGRVGLTMSYPSRVGVLWHIADRLSVLPEIAVERTTGQSVISLGVGFGFDGGQPVNSTTTRTTFTNWQIAPGANLLFDLVTRDDVATYITGGWSYRYITDTTVSTTVTTGSGMSSPPPGTERSTGSGHGFETRAAFGVRYIPRRHFGLFGEVGAEYGESTLGGEWDTTSTSLTTKGTAGGTIPPQGRRQGRCVDELSILRIIRLNFACQWLGQVAKSL